MRKRISKVQEIVNGFYEMSNLLVKKTNRKASGPQALKEEEKQPFEVPNESKVHVTTKKQSLASSATMDVVHEVLSTDSEDDEASGSDSTSNRDE